MKGSFPAACRLNQEKDIQAVFARRDVFRGKRLVFYRGENKGISNEQSEPISRFAIMVPRACGSAVRRNRIKRLVRELIRTNRVRIPAGFDYIIRAGAGQTRESDIKQEVFLEDFKAYYGWSQ